MNAFTLSGETISSCSATAKPEYSELAAGNFADNILDRYSEVGLPRIEVEAEVRPSEHANL